MPVTGVKTVKANMKRIFKDISEKKAPQFVNAVLSIGQAHSRELAPIEFSLLVNSVIRDVDVTSMIVSGTLSYNTKYAAALEFRMDWKPRPPSMKKGPAWNPKAKPGFLRKGFNDPESRSDIKRAEKIFKI